jgi:phosphoribosylformimino-5-aminoimidazole carboxamide ribonucleotide (ProFAR) isomerase
MRMLSRSAVASVAVLGALVAGALPASAITRTPESSSSADGRVENAVQIGADLYIGGLFTSVDGTTHTRLAALNAATGVLDPNFSVDVNGEVTSLAVSGTTLYIAGSFSMVGTVARTNVAAIDTSTGTVLPFASTTSAIVYSIDVANGVAYLGGKFTNVNGTTRKYLAAVDATTGTLESFNPKPLASVYVVKAAADGVYVGGNFQTIGGASRNYAAKLDASGGVTSWDAGLPFDSQVFDLTVDNGNVYLATGGHSPGGNSVYSVTADTGAFQWQVQTDGNVQSVEVANGMVYAGGHFNYLKPCVAGVCTVTDPRKKALSVDPAAGGVSSWNPTFNSSLGVWDFTAAGGSLYALGDFTTVNKTSQPHIARFAL